MRIVFLGTPDFAVPSLKILLDNGFEVPAVVTAPDKPGGRLGILESPVKQFARERSLSILQPEKLKNPDFLAELKAFNADLQVVVAFRMLPELVWNMPPMGTMNLHGSLLPKYRGAAPINWAIMNGETETGVTTFLLKHAIDTGDLLYQEKIPIGAHETAGELHDRMMIIGAELVLKSVQALARSTVIVRPQTDTEATHAPKLFTESCRIDFTRNTATVHNFIRGLSPHPGAWTELDGRICKIPRSEPAAHLALDAGTETPAPGQYFSDGKNWLVVRTSDGFIRILELQLEGKRRLDVRAFLNGYHPPVSSDIRMV